MSNKSTTPTVTTDAPKDPRWDQVRETSEHLRACGRLFLRGQVKLGMMLAALKKELGIVNGKGLKTSADSAKVPSWEELVRRETGYSRRQCDEFIRLAEACKLKLKTAKKLDLPAPAKKNAIVLFQQENALTLTDEQWKDVDAVIGSLTTGETQASLMQELGLVPKPKVMPTGKKDVTDPGPDQEAGQLAFHFFDAVAAPLINARTNPDYKKLLYALPVDSSDEHPLSLSTIEAEARALLADVMEAKSAAARPAKGSVIEP
jgi:hypothetical protein